MGQVLSSGRPAALSDGVVAVALTALVLPLTEVEVPQEGTWSALLDAYGGQISAFLISFLLVALYWLVHHRMWSYVTVVDARLLWLLLAWLLGIVLIPFATALLYGSDTQVPVVGIQAYAGVNLFIGVCSGLMWWYLSHHRHLTDGRMGVHPLWWSMRWTVWWFAVLLASGLNPSGAATMLALSGVAMVLVGMIPSPSRARPVDDPDRRPVAGDASA